MRIIENYNSAKQKYGIEIVDSLSKLGLPPQYLLSACRFVTRDGFSQKHVINLFKEWMKYVVKYNNIDVNTLSYEEFYDVISQEKSKHCVPNIIFNNGIASLGKLNNAKDVQSIPVRNRWCITSQRWFKKYTSKGYEFFVIYLSQEPLPYTFVIAAIVDGDVEYYDSNDYEQFENLGNPKETNNSDHEVYQRKLPQEIVSYLYNIAANQTERKRQNNENKIHNTMKKNVVRLTEDQLHKVIKESVKKVLTENDETEMAVTRPNRGLAKGKVMMEEDDYAIFKKFYHDIIQVLEDGVNKGGLWDDSVNGQTLRKIWDGPIADMREFFVNNMPYGEWHEMHDGIEHW